MAEDISEAAARGAPGHTCSTGEKEGFKGLDWTERGQRGEPSEGMCAMEDMEDHLLT